MANVGNLDLDSFAVEVPFAVSVMKLPFASRLPDAKLLGKETR